MKNKTLKTLAISGLLGVSMNAQAFPFILDVGVAGIGYSAGDTVGDVGEFPTFFGNISAASAFVSGGEAFYAAETTAAAILADLLDDGIFNAVGDADNVGGTTIVGGLAGLHATIWTAEGLGNDIDLDSRTDAFNVMGFQYDIGTHSSLFLKHGTGSIDTLSTTVFPAHDLDLGKDNEGIGRGDSGVTLDVVWGSTNTATDTAAGDVVQFIYRDSADGIDVVVGSGSVTSFSLKNVTAKLDTSLTGFWNDAGGTALDFSTVEFNFSMDHTGVLSVDITEVPEPAIVALFGLGLLGLGVAGRRRAKKAA